MTPAGNQGVYDHLEVLKGECEEAGIPLHIVSNGNIRDDALDPEKRFASILRTEEEKGQGTLFDMECEGMCGI